MHRLCFLAVVLLPFMASALPTDTLTLANATGEELRDQRLKESHKIVSVGGEMTASQDSVRRLVELFYIDQFRHFQDPLAPYFMLMSKDAKTMAVWLGEF